MSRPTVSVIVPCRDERAKLPQFLASLEAQTLAPDEVVVADGMSTDGTREWLEEHAATRPWLRVVDNPDRLVPHALNTALAAATGDLVARMDTHADYDPAYLATVVAFLEDNPDAGAVGGSMETSGRGAWGLAIAATLRRPFGLGGARHRVGGEAGPIPHVFSGCYRREVLEAIGGWDTRLHANEDFEADIRINASGATVHLQPDARTVWYVRDTVPGLAKQMWRYGYYKGLTLHLHPDALQPRQLAPPVVVAGLALGWFVSPRATAAGAGAYAVASATLGARAAHADGADPLRGAAVPAVVHLCWGAGLLAGLVRFAGYQSRR